MKRRPARHTSSSAGLRLEPRPFRALEHELARLSYRGIAIGPTLNDALIVNFLWGNGDWASGARWVNKARLFRHFLRPRHARPFSAKEGRGRILVTWQDVSPRFDEMLLPIVAEIGPARCEVVTSLREYPAALAPEVPVRAWEDAIPFRVREWRRHYVAAAPGWRRQLKALCQQHGLPTGSYELLALRLLISSQWIEGALAFLAETRPALVLTDYDRNIRWACLVLAARSLGIPTVSLVHGAIRSDAIGFSPVLADRLICWGTADRNKLIEAGEPPDRVLVGGCPRLSRDLPVSKAEARSRMGLDLGVFTVMLATSPDRSPLDLAEVFCLALEDVEGVQPIVRLHPAESPSDYAEVIARHPGVRFLNSEQSSLDESLAAADLVVVRGSGVGADALLKRKNVAVLSPDGQLAGFDVDLVESAGCTLTRTPEDLRQLVSRMRSLGDQSPPAEQAERYLTAFCAAYGPQAAKLTAQLVISAVGDADACIPRADGMKRMPGGK